MKWPHKVELPLEGDFAKPPIKWNHDLEGVFVKPRSVGMVLQNQAIHSSLQNHPVGLFFLVTTLLNLVGDFVKHPLQRLALLNHPIK